jgi:alpha-L-fucosidase
VNDTSIPAELAERPLPHWYDDAKLGIFVHWGIYSVPAWAPKGRNVLDPAADPGEAFRQNPYAEWYLNTLSIDGTPTAEHHHSTYGDAPYDGFAPTFRAATDGWDPTAWADLFAAAGARYAVLTTKHHDGFLLWPSRTPNPHKPQWQTERDLVGDLGDAVRAKGLRYGLYYSGGIDWTFKGLPIRDFSGLIAAIPFDDVYADYADGHWDELVERYQPAVLWNDIHYPGRDRSHALMRRYYDAVPDGVVNDRFDVPGVRAGQVHADFVTPEYASPTEDVGRKWEICRGLGNSFGLNRAEDGDDLLTADALVALLVDTVARGGNLLLNVGPAGDGTIPAAQADRLLALGWWLRTNGEAIYGTRPSTRADGTTATGEPVRFTTRDGDLYAIVLGTPPGTEVVIDGLVAPPGAIVHRLGSTRPLASTQAGRGLRITLPDRLAGGPAHTFRVSPGPA